MHHHHPRDRNAATALRHPLTVRQYQRILEKKHHFPLTHSLTKSVADLQSSYRNSIHILINITLMQLVCPMLFFCKHLSLVIGM